MVVTDELCFNKIHCLTSPELSLRDKCYVGYLNAFPYSAANIDDFPYMWVPVTSVMSGQTVLLGLPVTAGTAADCLREFPEFRPYYPQMEQGLSDNLNLINAACPMEYSTFVFDVHTDNEN